MYLEILGGLVLLVAGGDALVRGAVSLARRLGVSPLLIGLTLVGFGTSTPELVTSVQAALVGSPGIAVGNVIGSNIANVLLILGVAAAIAPLPTVPAAFVRDGAMLAITGAAAAIVVLAGTMGRVPGGAFLLMLAVYIVYTYLKERTRPDAGAEVLAHEAEDAPPGPRSAWLALLLAAGGIGLTVLGADLLVGGAIALARALGASEAVIGLTIVAVGTSLPELVTSVTAALRRHADVAVGNIVGSNIYNSLGILGATALVRPLAVPARIAAFDIWVMLAATVALILFMVTGRMISRREAWVFLAAYAAYLAALAGQAAA